MGASITIVIKACVGLIEMLGISINQVRVIGHMQHINILALYILHWEPLLHTRNFTCLCLPCDDIWNTKIANQIFVSGHFTNCPCICGHWLYIHLGLPKVRTRTWTFYPHRLLTNVYV